MSLLAGPPPPPEIVGAQPPEWFPFAGAALALLLAVVGLVWLVRVLPRVRRARTTTGTIVDVGLRTGTESRIMWRLDVEFADGDGVLRRGQWVGQSSLDRTDYRPGMQVPVRYDPVSGRVVDLPGGRRPPALLVPSLLVVLGVVLAAGFWFITS